MRPRHGVVVAGIRFEDGIADETHATRSHVTITGSTAGQSWPTQTSAELPVGNQEASAMVASKRASVMQLCYESQQRLAGYILRASRASAEIFSNPALTQEGHTINY